MSIGRLVVAFAGTGAAEGAAVAHDFTLEVDAFAAFGADYARTFEAGEIFRRDLDADPFFVEEYFIGELRVGFLLTCFFLEFGEHFASGLL